MSAKLKPELREIKNKIETEILNEERIKNEKSIYQETLDILENASHLINKARNKHELLFIYRTLSKRLYEAGMICKQMRNPDLGKRLILISKAIKDVLKYYVIYPLHNIIRKSVISRLWPHNCQNIKNLKDVLREYVIENAVLLFCYGRLVIDFLNSFNTEIEEATDQNLLKDAYEKIQYEARQTAKQHFVIGDYEYAWQYGVIGLVIEYMLSDFEHCFDRYMYSGKQVHQRTAPLRFRGYKEMRHQRNKTLTEKLSKTYATMESIIQKLRAELAAKIGQHVEQEFEYDEVEKVYNILIEVDLMLDKARTEREIIAIYYTIAERLKEVTHKYKSKIRIASILYRLAEIIHESIKEYLPHRVYETDLVKLLWPHNCNNLKQMKSLFYEYVLNNTALLGYSYGLAIDFLDPYMEQISATNDLHQLKEMYEDIQVDLVELEDEAYKKGEYKGAWGVSVIASVIGYLLSDFEHCTRRTAQP